MTKAETEINMTASKKKDSSTTVADPVKRKLREWTIEQETVLFKAICRFKPAGQHKHFRMLSIYQMVNNLNVTPNSGEGPLSTAEIWEKLGTLYNLEGLDELEDSSSFMASEEQLVENSPEPPYHGSLGGQLGDGTFLRDFILPWDEYGSLIESQALETSDSRATSPGYESEAATNPKKRSRSQSIDSRHTEESEEEGNESVSERGSEAGSTRATPTITDTPKTSTPKRTRPPASTRKTATATRATRSTRQRAATGKKPTKKETAAAAAAAAAAASPSPAPTNEDVDDTNSEHSEKEQSPQAESPKQTPAASRTKRGARQTKPSPKGKATPSRRSSRRK